MSARDADTDVLKIVEVLALELHPHRAGHLHIRGDSSLDHDLGFDSLSRVELMLRLEQAFTVTLPEQVMATAETPQDLLRALESAQPAAQGGTRTAHAKPVALEAVESTPERAGTLIDALEWHVERHGDRPHVTLLGEDGAPEVMTYAALLEDSRRIAAGLLERDLRPGQPVAIMLASTLDYFHSFMGVLLAGGIPVPIYPPARPAQIEDHLRRHATILDNARTPVLITVPEAKIAARLLRMQVLSLQHIVTPDELRQDGHVPRLPAQPADIAHLQYTSGSTGNPKGVMLTHDNLLANIRAMGRALEVDSTDVFVSWLPLYHDMGLIGAWLGTLYFAVPLFLMSPLTFLARPERWLWAIHDHRGTISGGPNFAFELCLKRISDEQLAGLDLGSWRAAFNGAEPVIPNTLRRFRDRFAAHGLRPEALKPVYGLAECSVGLAFPPLGREPIIDSIDRETLDKAGRAEPAGADAAQALEFVACGAPLHGHEARVVDDSGHELGEREEGRLEFRGPSATTGYYRNAEASADLFHDGWLDSGDMAYIAGGDIFLTGRRKDIVIRAGRNIYPHELEEAIGELDGVRKGCVAVFGSTDARTGTERLVALAETREKDDARREVLREAIDALAVDLLGTPLDDVVLAPPHSVPKTSSGKIRRASSRELYELGAVRAGRRAVWLQVVRLWLTGLLPQVRRARRGIAQRLYGAYVWALFCLLAPPVWLMVTLCPHAPTAMGLTRAAGRLLLGLAGIRLTVHGRDNLPAGRTSVVCVNHGSYVDALIVLVALPGTWSFVAKRELAGVFASRWFLRNLGTQFVERFDKQRGVEDARRVAASMQAGRPLVFFPEGTFRRQPGLLPFHMGAFQTATDAGAPAVPVAVRGTRSLLRDGQWLPRRTRVTVEIAPPVEPEGTGWNAAVALRDRVRAELLRRVGEPDRADDPGLR